MRTMRLAAVTVLSLALFSAVAVAAVVNGTHGNDILGGTPKKDKIRGKGGNDLLGGNARGDILRGGGGDDEVYGQRGKDETYGGRGADFMSEFDPLSSGGPFRGARAARQRGGGGDLPGNDRMFGQGGPDFMESSLGADLMKGGGGADLMFGDPGNDRMFGGGGPDDIEGEQGADRMFGGPGNDLIDAVDEDNGKVDRINCGPGTDVVFFNVGEDIVNDNCEIQNP